ncbi:hypothetical protein LTR85_010016 [Meristemomyces frigidus]|nr:hypothetical protein LTR85_010016 [Meristemomyces frigidus]
MESSLHENAARTRTSWSGTPESATSGLKHAPLLPMCDLYRPVLVTIIVGDPPMAYQVPRALVSGQSAYFAKAFSEHFKEGQEKVLRLPKVKRVVFEVFLGWLYTQRICQERLDDELGEESVDDDEGDEIERTDLEYGQSLLPRSWILSRVVKRKRSILEESETREAPSNEHKRLRTRSDTEVVDKLQDPGKDEKEERDQTDAHNEQLEQGGHRDGVQASGVDSEKDDRDDEETWDDAVTWTWSWLFEIYIFADLCDTRRFRTAIMETIQVKALQRTPKTYRLPHFEDFKEAFAQLPAASPLYSFLVDILTYLLMPHQSVSNWSTLPSEAIAATWLKAKQLEACLRCRDCQNLLWMQKICGCRSTHECDRYCNISCDAKSHPDVKTAKAPYYDDICQYHEHETREEEHLCFQRWRLIKRERDI